MRWLDKLDTELSGINYRLLAGFLFVIGLVGALKELASPAISPFRTLAFAGLLALAVAISRARWNRR